MKRYLFLMAWASGSEGEMNNCDGVTNVHEPSDLLPEYLKGNENVFAVRVEATNDYLAGRLGFAEALEENYTGHDTVSTYLEIDGVNVPDRDETPMCGMEEYVQIRGRWQSRTEAEAGIVKSAAEGHNHFGELYTPKTCPTCKAL